MIKKIIVITISIIVFLGVSLFGLYYFRNPLWVSKYEDSTYEYLDKYLYQYDNGNTLRGVLWMDFISYGDNYLHLQPTNAQGVDVKLPLISEEFINADLGSLNGEVYPIYLSLSFNSKEKNFLDEMLCSYIKGDYCNKRLELDSWRIYENTYPYPELSEEESKEIAKNFLLEFANDEELQSTYEKSCTMEISKLLSLEFEGEDIDLDTLRNMDCEDIYSMKEYAFLINSQSKIYPLFKEKYCDSLNRWHYDSMPRVFSQRDIDKIKEVCGFENEVDIKPDEVYTFNEKDLRRSTLELLSYEGSSASDIAFMKGFLFTETFYKKKNKTCSDVLPSPELIYLSRLLLNK